MQLSSFQPHITQIYKGQKLKSLRMTLSMEKRSEKWRPPQPDEVPSPWLVYTHGNEKSNKIQTFCTMSNNKSSYIKSIPELRGNYIFASFDDWLLLRDFDNDKIFSLCNVVTLQRISLPLLFHEFEENRVRIDTCAFLPSSTTPDHNGIVVILFYKAIAFSCRVTLTASSTPTSWDQQSIEIDGGKTVIRWVSSTMSCNGVLYCTARTDPYGGILMKVELGDHDLVSNSLIFKSLGLKDPISGHCFHSPRFGLSMIESCGVLYWIFTSLLIEYSIQQVIKVEVWELDLSHLSWVRVDCLGNRAFFVGSHSSTWCWASSEGGFEGNCIYFTSEDDEYIYSYRLEDDSFTFLLPCSNLHTPFYGPTWVMPLHQRLLAPREFGTKIKEKVEKLSQGNMIIEQRELEQHDKNETQEENILSELPWDVISLISKHLHLFDYLNLRASCKTFRSVVPHTQWRPNNSLPLFMFSKNGKGLCQLRDLCRNDSYSVMIPHSPTVPTGIEFSKNGWVVVCTGGESLQFFNPFTRVKGEFPPCELMHIFSSMGFSTCPTSSDCLTVGIFASISCVLIMTLQSGDDTWQRHEFDHGGIEFQPSYCSPVYYKESFYFLDRFGNLGVFKLAMGKASWGFYPKPDSLLNDYLHSIHLVECDGELFSMFIGEVGSWIQVFSFDHSEQNWDELKGLGDYSLFIGHRSSVSVMAKEQGMENRIYLPWRKDNDIVFYSLKTCKYHISSSEDSMEDFYDMKGQSLCCWV